MITTPEGRTGGGPNFTAHWFVYDFEICDGVDGLKQVLSRINYRGFDVVGLTQNGEIYTVLFRRLAG